MYNALCISGTKQVPQCESYDQIVVMYNALCISGTKQVPQCESYDQIVVMCNALCISGTKQVPQCESYDQIVVMCNTLCISGTKQVPQCESYDQTSFCSLLSLSVTCFHPSTQFWGNRRRSGWGGGIRQWGGARGFIQERQWYRGLRKSSPETMQKKLPM